MTETDLSTWLSIADAATRIGCSTRTVERLGRAKHLEQRLRPQKGSPPVVVYNPDDVARIAALRRPTPPPFVLDAVGTGNGNGHAAGVKKLHAGTELAHAHGPTDADLVRQFVTLAIAALQSPPSPPVAEKVAESRLFLTIPEAAILTGLSQAYLRRKCQEGWAGAFKDGGVWKLRRADLETL